MRRIRTQREESTMRTSTHRQPGLGLATLLVAAASLLGANPSRAAHAADKALPVLPAGCANQTVANVVALDQPWFWNRYGAMEPQGMMYALVRDVVPASDTDGLPDPGVTYTPNTNLLAGQVKLRADKRPRPLVLRVNA